MLLIESIFMIIDNNSRYEERRLTKLRLREEKIINKVCVY